GHGGWAVSAQPVAAERSGDGRRAPALLRGYDPGGEAAGDELGEVPAQVWRRRAGAHDWLALPEGSAVEPDNQHGGGGRRRSSGGSAGRAASGTPGIQEKPVYGQDLQLAREYFAVFQRARNECAGAAAGDCDSDAAAC